MSTTNGNSIPAQRTTDDRHRPSRNQLRQRAWDRDLRDALDEAAALRHYERVLVGA